ncbi:hypothetical protein PMIN04_013017 [Paraphaeosphaeria minitans]
MFGVNPALRLATQAINRGEAFAKDVASHGHVYQFQPESTSIQSGLAKLTMNGSADVGVRSVRDHPDIEDLTHENTSVPAPSNDDIIDWINEIYHDSRGFELGTFDATILAVTLKAQAANWSDIAHGYISDMIALVHSFIIEVQQQIAPSRRVSDGIKSLLLDDLYRMYRGAIDHTQFLLDIELDGTPATYNSNFNENLQKSRNERLRADLVPKRITDCKHGTVVRLDDIVQSHSRSNARHTTLEIHDILCSYYEVARNAVR